MLKTLLLTTVLTLSATLAYAEESGVSDIAMDMYSYVVHAVGSFTLEVVK